MAPESLPEARWSLGRYGTIINTCALVYAIQVWFWTFWPTRADHDMLDLNFAAPVFCGVVVAALLSYSVARKVYTAPASLLAHEY